MMAMLSISGFSCRYRSSSACRRRSMAQVAPTPRQKAMAPAQINVLEERMLPPCARLFAARDRGRRAAAKITQWIQGLGPLTDLEIQRRLAAGAGLAHVGQQVALGDHLAGLHMHL